MKRRQIDEQNKKVMVPQCNMIGLDRKTWDFRIWPKTLEIFFYGTKKKNCFHFFFSFIVDHRTFYPYETSLLVANLITRKLNKILEFMPFLGSVCSKNYHI